MHKMIQPRSVSRRPLSTSRDPFLSPLSLTPYALAVPALLLDTLLGLRPDFLVVSLSVVPRIVR
jgi:hypothetical protein